MNSKASARAMSSVRNRSPHSILKVAFQLSMTALSCELPGRLMLQTMPQALRISW
jgi:hypothetical protein